VAMTALCLVAVSFQLFATEPPLHVAHRGLLFEAYENTHADRLSSPLAQGFTLCGTLLIRG